MTKRLLIRLLCLLTFATACGWWISTDVWHKHLLGREAYLQTQGAYFDKSLANMAAPPVKFIEYTIFIGMFFALYEGLALILRVLFRVTRIEDVEDRPNNSR
jgi:hypothetical protein